MKPLFILPLFVVLSVAVFADQGVVRSDIPLIELVTLREVPSYSLPNDTVSAVSASVYSGQRLVIPIPYTEAPPPEMSSPPLPEPLVLAPLLPPLLPKQDRTPPPAMEAMSSLGAMSSPDTMSSLDTIRAQAGMEGSAEMLSIPPPLPGGLVPAGTIDSKLIDDPEASEWDDDYLSGLLGQGGASGQPSSGTPATSLGNEVLVFATIITTFGLIYMAFIAYDYRQRWMHSLTAQNDRYIIGGTYDMDTEDLYGGSRSFSEGYGFSDSFSLSDGFGLVRRPI
jgi:hypothetical protein